MTTARRDGATNIAEAVTTATAPDEMKTETLPPKPRLLPPIGSTLTDRWVSTETGTPDRLKLYAWDVASIGKYPRAAEILRNGGLAWFAICERKPAGGGVPPVVVELVGFGVGDVEDDDGHSEQCVRFVGENNDPNGAGSHSLIASWYGPAAIDKAHVSAALAAHLERRAAKLEGGSVFLLENGVQP